MKEAKDTYISPDRNLTSHSDAPLPPFAQGAALAYNRPMIHFESPTVASFFYGAAIVAGLLLLYLGYRFGKWMGTIRAHQLIQTREQELFTAQKGFKNLYEQELATLKQRNAEQAEQIKGLEARVEDYRKKAAGLGGLFSSGSKRADAMYALLLENEALEEALLQKNEKLRQERTEAVEEQLRQTGYRRVLISQLMNDDRVKNVLTETLTDDKRLPEVPHHSAPENGERP